VVPRQLRAQRLQPVNVSAPHNRRRHISHPALGQDRCLRTGKVICRLPAHRTGPCYPGVLRPGDLHRAADATTWVVIRSPDHIPGSSFARWITQGDPLHLRLQPLTLPPWLLRLLPAGAKVAGWDFHPQERRRPMGTLKNPIRGIFQHATRKLRFPLRLIFKRLGALKWRSIRAPHGHLAFFKAPLSRRTPQADMNCTPIFLLRHRL
jgi:hypothetical protein